ncbi:MAG: hypothetical protein AB8B48_16875 [Pseudomonadales bacterium]
MFVMLSSFNLRDGETVETCQTAIQEFGRHMHQQQMLVSVGPLGMRVANTPMDTDDDRQLNYYFLSYFESREQSDHAYKLIQQGVEPSVSIHRAMISKVRDAVFTCWNEIE